MPEWGLPGCGREGPIRFGIGGVGREAMIPPGLVPPQERSDVEAEVDDVPVLDGIVPALDAQEPLFTGL